MTDTPTLKDRLAQHATRRVALLTVYVLVWTYIDGLVTGVKLATYIGILLSIRWFIENNDTIQELHWSSKGLVWPGIVLLASPLVFNYTQYSLPSTLLVILGHLFLIPIMWLRYNTESKNSTTDEYGDKHAEEILNNQ